jgi:hypothetical protein
MRRARALAFALAALLAACSDSGGPNTGGVRPPGDLAIIKLAPGHAAIWNPVDSFYAVKGQDRELRIYFTDENGVSRGEEYVRLRVDAASLLTMPNGTPIQVGDSVLITVRVPDPDLVEFQFEPSGLKFDPAVPAQLKIEYNEANPDYNEDGHEDGTDAAIKQQLAVWRQEQTGQSYMKVNTVNVTELDECNSDLVGFTRYAIAY